MSRCELDFDDTIQSLCKYNGKYFNEILFKDVLIQADFLRSLDIMIRSTNKHIDSELVSLKFLLSRTVRTKEEEKIELYNRTIIVSDKIKPGYSIFIRINHAYFDPMRTVEPGQDEEYILLHLDNGDKYAIDKYYNIEFVYSFNNWYKIHKSGLLYAKGSQFKIVYSNISDYIQIFRDLYVILNLNEVEKCDYFIKFIKMMDRKIEKNFYEYSKFYNPNKMLLISNLISSYTAEKGQLSKFRRIEMSKLYPSREKHTKSDINIIIPNMHTSIERKLQYIIYILIGAEYPPGGYIYNDHMLVKYEEFLENFDEYYKKIDNVLNFRENIEDKSTYSRYMFENINIYVKLLLIMDYLNITRIINMMSEDRGMDEDIFEIMSIDEINYDANIIFDTGSDKYSPSPTQFMVSLLEYLKVRDLITFNLDDIWEYLTPEYNEDFVRFYRFVGIVPQNMIGNEKYNETNYEEFIYLFVDFILMSLEITISDPYFMRDIGFNENPINEFVAEPFIINGVQKFIQDSRMPENIAVLLLDAYNNRLNYVFEEKGLLEYANRLNLDMIMG